MSTDKTAAYQTLYECLVSVTKMMAPFAPFLAEELYRNLDAITGREQTESVHLSVIPDVEPGTIDAALETRMKRAQTIVMLVRAMRMKSNLKVRQPLKRIMLPVTGEQERADVQHMEDLILDEINVKSIEYVTDESGIISKKAKANFKSIGPKFGKSVQQVAARIKEMTAAEINALERNASYELPVNGSTYTIVAEDVEIIREDIQGWLVESEGGLTVALDIALDEALIAEGNAREFVNRIQNMRKDAGFLVTDRINMYYKAPERFHVAIQAMAQYIRNETLAILVSNSYKPGEFSSILDINGEQIEVGIERTQTL